MVRSKALGVVEELCAQATFNQVVANTINSGMQSMSSTDAPGHGGLSLLVAMLSGAAGTTEP